jgi:phosphatidylinositol 3-kinase
MHLKNQEDIIQKLCEMATRLSESNDKEKKAELCKQWLSKGGEYHSLAHFSPIPFPMNPNYTIVGVNSNVKVFNSNAQPLLIRFNTLEQKDGKNEFPVIFKVGDDLRQDQLVLQLIELMDDLLKRENLDMKLTIYRALATSAKEGMIELVSDCYNVSDVIKKYPPSMRCFLKEFQPDKTNSTGIKAHVLDTFLRSCAGYCVITYILGVGDRHLDNLLMSKEGNLFHIDFGFILGRDPKPWPPPMKISPEMVEAMGEEKEKFKRYCFLAYTTLRKSSNLILNLVSLMIDAGIEHINQGDKSVLKVQEKFKSELTDEEACGVLNQLIDESISAVMPQVTEAIHRWKIYWTQ